MNTEFEATFIDINVNQLREKLKTLGGELVRPETLMKRVIFHTPVKTRDSWLRVRDEGNGITMSLKQILGNKRMDEQKEIELKINDFNEGVNFLKALNAKQKAYHETKRESWEYGGVEIDFDTWPGLDTFVEIEGDSEEAVRGVVADLGLDFSQAIFGSADIIYKKKLNIPVDTINNKTPVITFAKPPINFNS